MLVIFFDYFGRIADESKVAVITKAFKV